MVPFAEHRIARRILDLDAVELGRELLVARSALMGGYSHGDFLKVGLPLNLIAWATAIVMIQAYFPF